LPSSTFTPFGAAHLGALGVTVLVALGAALLVRRGARLLLRGLAAALLLAGVGFVAVDAWFGASWRSIAPLHLCDVAVFVGAYALWTRRQQAYELSYFWGLGGASLALLTPDLGESFPHYRFVFYFAQHGLLVVAAVALTAGAGMRPGAGGAWRAWLWLNLLALGVAAVDQWFGVNFMYLCAAPGVATPLDWLGGWPWYLVAGEILALGVFAGLARAVTGGPSGSPQ
jgi:hypothetical integral membrane protein (TIGR02206 family)